MAALLYDVLALRLQDLGCTGKKGLRTQQRVLAFRWALLLLLWIVTLLIDALAISQWVVLELLISGSFLWSETPYPGYNCKSVWSFSLLHFAIQILLSHYLILSLPLRLKVLGEMIGIVAVLRSDLLEVIVNEWGEEFLRFVIGHWLIVSYSYASRAQMLLVIINDRVIGMILVLLGSMISVTPFVVIKKLDNLFYGVLTNKWLLIGLVHWLGIRLRG